MGEPLDEITVLVIYILEYMYQAGIVLGSVALISSGWSAWWALVTLFLLVASSPSLIISSIRKANRRTE